MTHLVLGAFIDKHAADQAVKELTEHDIAAADLSIITLETDEHTVGQTLSDGAKGALNGGIEGGLTGIVIGGLAGLLVTAGTYPGLADFFIGGPAVTASGLTGSAATITSAALTGLAAGGLAGALVGSLVGMGMSRTDAQKYKDIIDDDGYLLAVPVSDETEKDVKNIFELNHAKNVKDVDIDK